MASKSLTQTNAVALIVAVLKQVQSAADYHQLGNDTDQAALAAAWELLPLEEQNRITQLVASSNQPQAIAAQLIACDSPLELKQLKSEYGDEAVKSAWQLLSPSERERIKAICNTEPQPKSMTATPEAGQQPQRTLFDISTDLEKLNELLDDCGDDTQQQELLSQWFEQLGEERDRKLDNYAALMAEMSSRAAARKGEARRLQELAQSDENRVKLLKERLKWFFTTHQLKQLETARYKLSLSNNGGKRPLVLDDSIPVTQLPQQFQRLNVEPDTQAIREALEAGHHLPFAQLGERGQSLRIQ